MRMHVYAVYILTNKPRGVLYVGVTGNLIRRLLQHRSGCGSRFVRRYHLARLVHVQFFGEARLAIAREKQLKAGSRRKKVELVEASNPGWDDLTETYLSLRGGPAGADEGIPVQRAESSASPEGPRS